MKNNRSHLAPLHRQQASQAATRVRPGSHTALHDPRWPAVAAALAGLREKKRHAVRIVDLDCGAGCLLLQAVRYARVLGFTAIEGRGVDGAPSLIGRARSAAAREHDPAIGIVFELADVKAAIRDEYDAPADIVLWRGRHGGGGSTETLEAIRRAGDLIISDDCEWRADGEAA